MNNIDKLKELESKIQYSFHDFGLLEMAMRHSSYANEHHMERLACNERLEFLGDAVLEVVSSEFLYNTYPRLPEGEMTKKRASLVCEPALAFCAREINLGSYLLLGKGEEATGGRYRDSIVSDAMEATIGAIFLDGGFDEAKQFVLRFVLNDAEHKQLFHDSKTILQEMIQSETDQEILYQIVKEEGPDHDKNFSAQVSVGSYKLGTGSGRTKKAAEQQAAYNAILNCKNMSR
ncbi:MAG: ribonuclease III [Fusicatenibacter sp.]|nr:ribonuclease III [Lachnospiraceae bacterium]MDY2938381.1 ribonuclease III [Fusicatenibacter sp.]